MNTFTNVSDHRIFKTLRVTLLFTIFLSLLNTDLFSQKQTQNWYFANYAGLNFVTNPPTLVSGAMYANEGSTAMSDANGNLLFYTEGNNVYNKTHAIMANGTGLMGNGSTTQAALAIKQPGNLNIYFVFTLDAQAGPNGLRYSVIDMSLAAGMGSVTLIKNVPLYAPSTEKLCATLHCNGVDVWVMTHDFYSSTFRAYLLTSAGVNTTPVLSNVGTYYGGQDVNTQGNMKFSPTGKKLALASRVVTELCDFDNSTGVVSNPFALTSPNTGWACEFSPDGTKLYSSAFAIPQFSQWDLCAGSNSAIAASQVTIASNGTIAMQLGLNGKIYCGSYSQTFLSVINNPNVAGIGCNYAPAALSISPYQVEFNLPNFMSNYLKQAPSAFTYTTSCQKTSFASAQVSSSCTGPTYSLTSQQWLFGDPLSGAADTSYLSSPIHVFSDTGAYTVKLINFYQCSTDTVTLKITIAHPVPTLSVAGTFTICKGEHSAYTASGASTYTWNTTSTASSIFLAPVTTTGYTLTGSNSLGCSASKVFTVTVSKCTGINVLNNDLPLRIFPNPLASELSIETEVSVKLTVFDMKGELIFDESFEPGNYSVNTAHIRPGIYILKALSKEGVKTTRLVKME